MALDDAEIAAMLPVRDLDVAKKWYKDKLGLSPSGELHDGAFYIFKNGRFVLYPSEGSPTGLHTQLVFKCTSVSDEVEILTERGVEFEHYDSEYSRTDSRGITFVGGIRVAFFKDHDGNLLGISESAW